MKNKRLIVTIIGITLLVVGSLLMKKAPQNVTLKDKKIIKVGILQLVTHEALDQIEQGIEDELTKHPVPSKTVEIQLLNAEGDQNKLQTMSQQLTATDNDIVVGIATPAAQGLATATKDKPVVMSAISDPIGAKLVKNLNKPEGNVTGLSNVVPVKQTVDLIQELTPRVKTIGILYASNEDNSLSQVKDFQKAAQNKGYKVLTYSVPSTNEVPSTMSVMTNKVDALFIPQDNTIASAFATVISASKAAKIPVYSSVDTMVRDGSIASISQNQYDLGVETAKQVKLLMSGKGVGQVPVKVIDTGKPIINRQVAMELGITIPEQLGKQADFVGTK